MTRPARNRLLVVAFWVGCLLVGYWLPREVLAPLLVAVALTIAASLWVCRDFFGARRALRRKDWVTALTGFERFERALLTTPARQRLAFVALGIYSFDAVAIARNNVGVVHLSNDQLARAEAAFASALERDARYAVPHLNLAVVAGKRHDAAEVDKHLARASALGLGGKRTQRQVRALLTS